MSTPLWTNHVHTREICEGDVFFYPLITAVTGYRGAVGYSFTADDITGDPWTSWDDEIIRINEDTDTAGDCQGWNRIVVTAQAGTFTGKVPVPASGDTVVTVLSGSEIEIKMANESAMGGFFAFPSDFTIDDTLFTIPLMGCM
jgi:hypothetical protein